MEERKENRAKGNKGESIAAKQMLKKGYEILDTNFCRKGGEIDIIARKDDIVVFAEVKYRKSLENGIPCEAVDLRKQKRIIETAKKYIDEKNLYESSFRFDVIEIVETDRIYMRHIENAFWEM
ncbi:MAG: YraN family protein [Firmicutes bacterium]|nr:YraN family protein [Bacillota bacterium]